jgi:hypothetical protein
MIPIDQVVFYLALAPATCLVALICHFFFWLGFQFFVNN